MEVGKSEAKEEVCSMEVENVDYMEVDREIHQENLAKLDAMSKEEIMEEQRKLLETLGNT